MDILNLDDCEEILKEIEKVKPTSIICCNGMSKARNIYSKIYGQTSM